MGFVRGINLSLFGSGQQDPIVYGFRFDITIIGGNKGFLASLAMDGA